MTLKDKDLMTVCCAAVLAFGLAACGSSSDDNDMPAVTDSGMPDAMEPEAEDAPAGPTPEEMAAEAAAATMAAGTKVMAINAEAGETGEADAGLCGSSAPNTGTAGAYRLSIKRDSDGTTVEISLEEAGEDDPKFMQAMDFEDGRTVHVRDNGMGEEEVVIVSTDIDEPTATPFAMVMGQELNARDLDPDVDAGGDGNDTNDFTALTVAAGTGDVNLPKIMPLFLYSSAR